MVEDYLFNLPHEVPVHSRKHLRHYTVFHRHLNHEVPMKSVTQYWITDGASDEEVRQPRVLI
jgi:hypothetical protein